jgi:hypothetical protein
LFLSNVPDLRNQEWFVELLYDILPDNRTGREGLDQIDWTEELGGWDLMNLFNRDYDNGEKWVYVGVDRLSAMFD